MKLSKQTADAVQILAFCRRLDDSAPIKVGTIGEAVGLSRQMALKLCYLLQQEGFLDAVRGPKGGVRLSERAARARLGEIVRALELQPTDKRAEGATSRFGGFIDEAFEAFLAVLDEHTLEALARESNVASPRSPARQPTPASPRRGSAARK